MEIVEIPVDDLTPHPDNERIYGDPVDDELVNSVRRLGILEPLLINTDGRIISGFCRWQAAQRLGLSMVPTRTFDSEDDPEELVEEVDEAPTEDATKEESE